MLLTVLSMPEPNKKAGEPAQSTCLVLRNQELVRDDLAEERMLVVQRTKSSSENACPLFRKPRARSREPCEERILVVQRTKTRSEERMPVVQLVDFEFTSDACCKQRHQTRAERRGYSKARLLASRDTHVLLPKGALAKLRC